MGRAYLCGYEQGFREVLVHSFGHTHCLLRRRWSHFPPFGEASHVPGVEWAVTRLPVQPALCPRAALWMGRLLPAERPHAAQGRPGVPPASSSLQGSAPAVGGSEGDQSTCRPCPPSDSWYSGKSMSLGIGLMSVSVPALLFTGCGNSGKLLTLSEPVSAAASRAS